MIDDGSICFTPRFEFIVPALHYMLFSFSFYQHLTTAHSVLKTKMSLGLPLFFHSYPHDFTFFNVHVFLIYHMSNDASPPLYVVTLLMTSLDLFDCWERFIETWRRGRHQYCQYINISTLSQPKHKWCLQGHVSATTSREVP